MYIILYIFLYISDVVYGTHSGSCGMGTVLFSASDLHKQCWSPEEIAILTTRMILEDLIPDVRILNIESDDYVNDIVEYFRLLINIVRKMSCGRKKHITMLALTDLLGGYLQHAVLPITRAAYYAGLLNYKSMEKLIQLYEELKWFLRTNGQGWSLPVDTDNDFDVSGIDFRTESPRCNKSCCRNLIYYRHEPSKKRSIDTVRSHCYFFPVPFLDSKVRPSAIAVPFKRYSLRNIESQRAAYLVMKYFISVERCFQDLHVDDSTAERFHNNMYTWVEKQVMPKLKDDKFYAAFGGILRVEESLRSLGAKLNEEDANDEGEEGEEEIGTIPGGETTTRSSMVLFAMLIIIFVWFIIGTLFICYRMRANNLKGKPCTGPKSDGTCSGSSTGSSKWSVLSKTSSKKSTDICKCCSSASDKSVCKCSSTTSGKSTGDTTTHSSEQDKRAPKGKQRLTFSSPCVCEGFAVIDTKHSMKVLPSIPEISENSSLRKATGKPRKLSFDRPVATSSKQDMVNSANQKNSRRRVCVPDLAEVDLATHNYSDKATSLSSSKSKTSGRERMGPQASGDSTDDTVVTANSPHIYACHSSLTGNYTSDQRYPVDKPYIFGYDFQTSSSSEVSDDDTDGKTSSTKYRCEDG